MRICFCLSILVLICTAIQGQILDLSNAKKERIIQPIPYDSSFINFSPTHSLEKKAGIVGQRLFIGDISSSLEIKDLKGNYLNPVSRNQFSNLFWKVIKVENDYPNLKFIIENESGKRLVFSDLSSNDSWYLEGGLQKAKTNFVGEEFLNQEMYPEKIESLNGEVFDSIKNLKIEDIQYAKLEFGFSLVAIFENGLISKVELDINDTRSIVLDYMNYVNVKYTENVPQIEPTKPVFSRILGKISEVIEKEEENEVIADKDESSGIGEYDDSGNGVFGRRVIYRDMSMIKNASSASGKIVFKVCINRRGVVTYAEIISNLTTIKNKNLLKKGLSSMEKYKYEPDFTAPKEQCGRYTLKIDNFNGVNDDD